MTFRLLMCATAGIVALAVSVGASNAQTADAPPVGANAQALAAQAADFAQRDPPLRQQGIGQQRFERRVVDGDHRAGFYCVHVDAENHLRAHRVLHLQARLGRRIDRED